MVFASMLAGLLLTAVIASAVPALRACNIEPTQALRSEWPAFFLSRAFEPAHEMCFHVRWPARFRDDRGCKPQLL